VLIVFGTVQIKEANVMTFTSGKSSLKQDMLLKEPIMAMSTSQTMHNPALAKIRK
jgi:hypothetical protein